MKAEKKRMLVILFITVLILIGCRDNFPSDVKDIMYRSKVFVGSDTCKTCHIEHYDSWKMTLHSRMTQDAKLNKDDIIETIDENKIRKNLSAMSDLSEIPIAQIYIPKPEEIKYTNGSQWAQFYIVEKNANLYVAPVKYNADTHLWVISH